MLELPDSSNFFCSIETALSREQLANLYESAGWQIRKSSFTDYEIKCEWAEMVIEADSPILIHGAVADFPAHAEELVAPLRAASAVFTAEYYGPEPDRQLLKTLQS